MRTAAPRPGAAIASTRGGACREPRVAHMSAGTWLRLAEFYRVARMAIRLLRQADTRFSSRFKGSLESPQCDGITRNSLWVNVDYSGRFLYGPRRPGFGARASTSATISSIDQSRSETPAAIAGVILRLLCILTKL